jgi:hypothetical protein
MWLPTLMLSSILPGNSGQASLPLLPTWLEIQQDWQTNAEIKLRNQAPLVCIAHDNVRYDRLEVLSSGNKEDTAPALWWYHTHGTSSGIAALDILLPVLPAAHPIRSTATRGAAHYADSLDQ